MNKKFLSVISLMLSLGVSVGCMGGGDGGEVSSESEKESASVEEITPPESVIEEDVMLDLTPTVPEGYIQLAVGEASGYKTEGYGCQVDTHIFKESYNNFYGEEESFCLIPCWQIVTIWNCRPLELKFSPNGMKEATTTARPTCSKKIAQTLILTQSKCNNFTVFWISVKKEILKLTLVFTVAIGILNRKTAKSVALGLQILTKTTG